MWQVGDRKELKFGPLSPSSTISLRTQAVPRDGQVAGLRLLREYLQFVAFSPTQLGGVSSMTAGDACLSFIAALAHSVIS